MHNRGMLPLLLSRKNHDSTGSGWLRTSCGDHGDGYSNGVCYYPAPPELQSKSRKYVLTFSHTFEYAEDEVYFAYCFPYAYSGEWYCMARYLPILRCSCPTVLLSSVSMLHLSVIMR